MTGPDLPWRALLAAAALSVLGPGPGLARDGLASVYSDLGPAACRRGNRTPPGRLGGHEPVLDRCRGLAHLDVDVTYLGAAVQVTVRPRRGPSPGPQLGAGYGVGPRIEWRGRQVGRRFVPSAAILRLQFRLATGEVASVLAVLRVGPGGICPVAWIDAGANPDANALARRSADAAAGFRCGTSRPGIVGAETALAREAAARAPGSPRPR